MHVRQSPEMIDHRWCRAGFAERSGVDRNWTVVMSRGYSATYHGMLHLSLRTRSLVLVLASPSSNKTTCHLPESSGGDRMWLSALCFLSALILPVGQQKEHLTCKKPVPLILVRDALFTTRKCREMEVVVVK